MLLLIITENGTKKLKLLTADTGAGNPVGTIIPMYKKSSPNGYLYCDGSTFDETQYPLLYAYLGSNVLPDLRELGLKGAEKNTTYIFDSTETDPSTGQAGTQNHDVFAQGEFKDDQLQAHGHDSITDNTQISAMGSGSTGWETKTYDINFSSRSSHTTNTKDCRKGTVTRGKSFGVFYYIKATSGLSENAQDNVVAQLNEERSYSTEEVNTGKKWIDGKDIYRKTVYIASTSSGSLDISSMNIDTPIVVANAVAYKYNGVADKQALPLLAGQISGGIAFQHASLTVTKYDASYNYEDIYITLEYTKTTDV
jgi:hypothetical protein